MSALEITKKFREVQRKNVKELINKVNGLFEQQYEHSEDDEIKALEEVLDKSYRTVAVLDSKVYDLMLCDSGITDKNVGNELREVYQHATDYFGLKYIISLFIDDSDSSSDDFLDEYDRSTLPFTPSKDSSLSSLQKLEKVLSNSKTKERSSLLSLITGMYNSRNMDRSEKLQNLAMVIKIVKEYFKSYPDTVEMCPEVVNAFKSTFGTEDLLTEFCIRELLDIILQSKSSSNKLSLSTLYNQLHCYLRSFHTLGITSEKYAPILFPLFSSCIPEETLKMWKSSGMSLVGKGYSENSCKDNLDNLMLFLKTVVEGEKNVALAMVSFTIDETNPVKSRCKKVSEVPVAGVSNVSALNNDNDKANEHSNFCSLDYESQRRIMPQKKSKTNPVKSRCKKVSEIPIAVGLYVSALNNDNDKASEHSSFCSLDYESQQCIMPQKKSLEDKRKIVESKKFCFCCLKRGHTAECCRSKPECKSCNKSH